MNQYDDDDAAVGVARSIDRSIGLRVQSLSSLPPARPGARRPRRVASGLAAKVDRRSVASLHCPKTKGDCDWPPDAAPKTAAAAAADWPPPALEAAAGARPPRTAAAAGESGQTRPPARAAERPAGAAWVQAAPRRWREKGGGERRRRADERKAVGKRAGYVRDKQADRQTDRLGNKLKKR